MSARMPARVPRHLIDQLNREISLERLVGAAGIELERLGSELVGRCPFCEGSDPTLIVSAGENTWRCGACGEGGSVVGWVMRAEGVNKRHAVELLQSGHQPTPIASQWGGVPPKHTSVPRLPSPLDADAADQELLRQVIHYYHATLKKEPRALAYLEQRGLVSEELIDRFKLGFANRTLGLRLPAKTRKAGREIRERLQRLGILRESSGHEHFTGALVVPVFDEQGQVRQIYGRKITPNLRKGSLLHLHLPDPRAGVWNVAAFSAIEDVILCESLIDAMTFWCAGHRNVTACRGPDGFTDEHLEAFRRHDIRRVLIAFDRDKVGDAGVEEVSRRLVAEGFECLRVTFPRGTDANEYALSKQPAQESLGALIRGATWLGKGRQPEPEPASIEPNVEPAQLPVTSDVSAQVGEQEVTITLGDRRYRVRGLARNTSFEQLRVNLMVSLGDTFHVDALDLYNARQRAAFVKQAGLELCCEQKIVKRDLGAVLLKLEALQEENIRRTFEPSRQEVEITDGRRQAALALLRDPQLIDRILEHFDRCGVVGEQTNKLVGYLAAVSRKLPEPLAVIVQSSSAAGKTSLMDAVLAFMPPEQVAKYSGLTAQSLFYMGESELAHKILAVVEEEGAERAAYALKLLQSEGELTIASTGKDPATGRHVTHQYHVAGPVMIFLTTIAVELEEELANRCLVLAVDEDREQTLAIHRLQRQRETLAGLLAHEDRRELTQLHQDAQRLLRPLAVVNPHAESLTFASHCTRSRRDHPKYLTLIRASALLHQYQREVKTVRHQGREVRYVEATPEDIALADRLAGEVLGRSTDELAPQTRRLLDLLEGMVAAECEHRKIDRADHRFTRREIQRAIGWSYPQVARHLRRLVDTERVLVHGGGRGRRLVYELLAEADLYPTCTPAVPHPDASLEKASKSREPSMQAPSGSTCTPAGEDAVPGARREAAVVPEPPS